MSYIRFGVLQVLLFNLGVEAGLGGRVGGPRRVRPGHALPVKVGHFLWVFREQTVVRVASAQGFHPQPAHDEGIRDAGAEPQALELEKEVDKPKGTK